MKVFKIIILVLLILLSISSGVAKIVLIPDELEFFGNFGLSDTSIMIFGIIQVLSGLLLIFKKIRKLGALLISVTFLFSSALIFIEGNIIFGGVSLIPVILLAWVVRESQLSKKFI